MRGVHKHAKQAKKHKTVTILNHHSSHSDKLQGNHSLLHSLSTFPTYILLRVLFFLCPYVLCTSLLGILFFLLLLSLILFLVNFLVFYSITINIKLV